MLTYPNINPVAFSVGPVVVHWYGIMYLIGFAAAWWLALSRAKKPHSGWDSEQVGDLIFYAALGVVLGGRIGYMLFYGFSGFIHQPWTLFEVWHGGMSFHGGMLGVVLATWIYARRQQRSWVDVIDFVAPLVPVGLAAGRLGNFINGELWGRVTTVAWGMRFPDAGPLPRHPSQLYEFLLEGVLFFTILWWYSSKPRPRFAVSAVFLIGYGSFRFLVEFFRQPDPQLGFVAWGWLTMGQLLSFPMILLGCLSLYYVYARRRSTKEL